MRMLTKIGTALLIMCCTLSPEVYAKGGIGLGTTRVIYPLGAAQTSLSIRNSESNERYLINSWVENASGVKDKRFVITPPLFVSEAKSENSLRIMYVGEPLSDKKETLFWVNVKAIPSVDKSKLAGRNVLQFAILSRIKLFVRPQNLSMLPEEARQHLSFSRQGNKLKITNDSPYYQTLVNIKLGASKLPATMVAPGGFESMALPAGAHGNINFQTVNDYGALSKTETGVLK